MQYCSLVLQVRCERDRDQHQLPRAGARHGGLGPDSGPPAGGALGPRGLGGGHRPPAAGGRRQPPHLRAGQLERRHGEGIQPHTSHPVRGYSISCEDLKMISVQAGLLHPRPRHGHGGGDGRQQRPRRGHPLQQGGLGGGAGPPPGAPLQARLRHLPLGGAQGRRGRGGGRSVAPS